MDSNLRRHDIDTLRVIAVFLLIFFHASALILYEGPMWGYYNDIASLDWLIMVREFMSTWRLPLLFLVSGMGVYFAFRKRTGKELLAERANRILVPLLFGTFVIVPVQMVLSQHIEHREYAYLPVPSHLWFLVNLMIYVVLLLPLFIFLKKRPDFAPVVWLQQALDKSSLTIYLLAIPYVALTSLKYVDFLFGIALLIFLIDFFVGFFMVMIGDKLWRAFDRFKVVNLALAVILHAVVYWTSLADQASLFIAFCKACEAVLFIFAVFGYGYRYLNRPIPLFQYLSKAVLPIYIIHWVVLYAVGIIFLPIAMPAWIKFIVVTVLTMGLCLAIYEWGIRRAKWLHRWFGMVRVTA